MSISPPSFIRKFSSLNRGDVFAHRADEFTKTGESDAKRAFDGRVVEFDGSELVELLHDGTPAPELPDEFIEGVEYRG